MVSFADEQYLLVKLYAIEVRNLDSISKILNNVSFFNVKSKKYKSLKSSIAGELQKRLKQIDELNELESGLNRNVAFLKKTVKDTQAVKNFNCFLMLIFTAVAAFYAAKTNILF